MFSIGDKVVCVDDVRSTQYNDNGELLLKKGEIYTIYGIGWHYPIPTYNLVSLSPRKQFFQYHFISFKEYRKQKLLSLC